MSLFDTELQYYLDEARKNVHDDPTLQPWVDQFQNEALESYQRSAYDMHDRAARDSLLGTGYYQGMQIGANEEYNEALQNSLANLYMGRFNQVEQNELAAIGQLNARDMNTASNDAQRDAARISAAPGHAQVRLASQQWRAQQPYTDIMNTIGILNGINTLGGYNMSEQYIPSAPGYYGPSAGAATLMGGIGGALQGYGMATTAGLFGSKTPAPQTPQQPQRVWQ